MDPGDMYREFLTNNKLDLVVICNQDAFNARFTYSAIKVKFGEPFDVHTERSQIRDGQSVQDATMLYFGMRSMKVVITCWDNERSRKALASFNHHYPNVRVRAYESFGGKRFNFLTQVRR